MPRSRSRPPTRPTAARVLALLVAVVLVAAAPPPAVTAAAGSEAAAPVARLLVGWRQGATPVEKAAAVEAVGARAVDRVGPLDVQVLEVPAARSTGALAALSGAPGVAYAEPDQEVTAAERVPTDPLWGEQWGLVLTRANRAWDTTVGSPSVVIAVLDSGVDPNHPDLAGALVPGTDFVNRDDDPADDFGHGTSVAAIAAARAGNGGIAGYCWTCAVMPVKVLDDEGVGSLAQIAAGVTYAADRGARVINLSLSAPSPSVTMTNAVAYARGRGALVVAAAGNDGDPIPAYPASTPGVVGVMGTDTTDGRYGFSNHGPWAELAAPGCHPSTRPDGTYGPFCGTSSASPAVAGIAGLLLAARPAATVEELERALLLTAAPTRTPGVAAHGRVDAAAAIGAITAMAPVVPPGSTPPGAPSALTATAGNASATVRWTPPTTDGGSPLTGYRVTASPGGPTAEVAPGATSFTLGPLANGTGYTVTVTAMNAVGASAVATVPPPAVQPAVTALERVAGAGRVETAVALSQRAFRFGAREVMVARADDYADALAAAPLAGTRQVPLLLSPSDQLPASVATEVRRLRATSAVLVGGPSALSPEVEAALRANGIRTVERVSGTNRFDTAGQLAVLVGGRSVYVTEGANADPNRGWPDAVAVSGLAAFQGRPILLTTRDELPPETAAALVTLGATSATVVGGTAAVAERVVGGLADPDGNGTRQVTVSRLAGATRWDTSRLVADRALAAGAGSHRLWLATGRDWPDALAAGPAAAAKAAVTLLVDGQDLAGSPPASTWLTSQNRRFWEVVLVGGAASIRPETEASLSALLR